MSLLQLNSDSKKQFLNLLRTDTSAAKVKRHAFPGEGKLFAVLQVTCPLECLYSTYSMLSFCLHNSYIVYTVALLCFSFYSFNQNRTILTLLVLLCIYHINGGVPSPNLQLIQCISCTI